MQLHAEHRGSSRDADVSVAARLRICKAVSALQVWPVSIVRQGNVQVSFCAGYHAVLVIAQHVDGCDDVVSFLAVGVHCHRLGPGSSDGADPGAACRRGGLLVLLQECDCTCGCMGRA